MRLLNRKAQNRSYIYIYIYVYSTCSAGCVTAGGICGISMPVAVSIGCAVAVCEKERIEACTQHTDYM